MTPLKPELKIREFDVYRAFYCGVCKSIGKTFGQLPRFALINETASLAIILTACSGQSDFLDINQSKCIAHPIRKRPCASGSQAITYAACVNVLLAYHKLMDSYYDNKSVLSKSGAIAIKRSYKKARRFSPILCDFIEIYMKDQLTLEKNSFINLLILDIDTYAEQYGEKCVRKNITIPAWLNTYGEKNHINFSRVLQDALLAKAQSI